MSRSLNRIRSLVSEIEQIQKQGQKPGRVISFPDPPLVAVAPPEPRVDQSSQPGPVKLNPPVQVAPEPESRVSMEWSGSVLLELYLPQTAEKIQLKQVGEWIEIRFSDGKAFHIPFKAVA
jgi:hypothetical protein